MVSFKTYQVIQNWIARQQEYERKHLEPAPLTDAQRKLLDKLELALPPEIPLTAEPELEEVNWIGLLLEYRAARQVVPSGTPGGNFIEEQGPTIGNELKWYCRVKIDENANPFPGPDGGLVDGNQPYFGRKKDAKKYAAKCAYKWLEANGYLLRSEADAAKPPPAPPAPQAPQAPQATQKQLTPSSSPAKKKARLLASSPKSPSSATVKTEPNPPQPLPASPFNSDEVSAVVEIDRLCARLGLANSIRYVVQESAELAGFFDGYAELGMLATIFPQDAGRVQRVIGKKAAKEKIAEELLAHMRKLGAEHDERDKRFLDSLGPNEEVQVPA
ncbi:hypothetical protein F5B19DRAFT_141132 [Rostrohypoxylon terebratum]|nr:hypothetical protein F5B19DRAFT_141132 [Rostrohypoxylon terebratum]